MRLSTKLLLSHVVAGTALLFAQAASAAITGSAHDFSADGWTGGQICVACHAPHDNANTAGNLLWNHAASTVTTYTMYSSPTIDGTVETSPTAISRVCLSCHDGSVALDSFGGATGSTYILAAYKVGTATVAGTTNNISTEHPISVTYDTADTGLWATSHATTITDKPTVNDLLFTNRVECASCHDVHNKYSQTSLLVKSNAASALCMTCHNK